MAPELSSDDDTTNFDDIPEPDSGEKFFPTPKVLDLVMIVTLCTILPRRFGVKNE